MVNNSHSEKTNNARIIERTVDQNVRKIKDRFSHTFDLRIRSLHFNYKKVGMYLGKSSTINKIISTLTLN